MIYKFQREPISGIILVYVWLDKEYKMKMALDTAASATTFDINVLRMAGYPVREITETGMVETANGIVEIGIFQVNNLSSIGHTVCNVSVQVYDFLAHGIISDYDGVLGLDFFEDTKFSIDMINQTIEIGYP